MRTIYKVFKKNFSLHSLIRVGFQSDLFSSRGVENENQNFFTVISDCRKPMIENLKYQKTVENLNFEKGEEVEIKSLFCFENRKTKQKIYKEEALSKFLDVCGLKLVSGECIFSEQRNIVKGEFPINNCFSVFGRFIVFDVDKFKLALKKGIGKRGSYGFGFIDFKKTVVLST